MVEKKRLSGNYISKSSEYLKAQNENVQRVIYSILINKVCKRHLHMKTC